MTPAPRLLDGTEEALDDLAALAGYTPTEAHRGVRAIEEMAERGFNDGQEVESEPGQWYWPEPPLGIYYADDGHKLTVQRVVDVRHRFGVGL